jgi:hypothetical protein
MSNQIVVVNTSIQSAPAPSTRQQTGALISMGGTTLADGSLKLITSLSDLNAILSAATPNITLAWATGVVTDTLGNPHGITVGNTTVIQVANAVPTGYNGTFIATATTATALTYPLTINPGVMTSPGTTRLGASIELNQMAETFFAQPQAVNQSVYVLELGSGTVSEGVTDLQTFIGDNPSLIYRYLIPREWDADPSFLAFFPDYDSPESLTYFDVTTTPTTYQNYTGHKSIMAIVESPNITTSEFSMAAQFAQMLNANPSSTNQVPPLSYRYVYGVTAYPIPGNGALFDTLEAANVGWIGTGAEGGISNTIVFRGQQMDGNPWNFWYAVDWLQLNLDLNLSNETIIGSNSNVSPLYYDQPGVTRLLNRSMQTASTAVSYGLANGQVKGYQLPAKTFRQNYLNGDYIGQVAVNAEPFLVYVGENPDDYPIGRYAGISAVVTPNRGFIQILFDLQAQNFIGAP